MRLERLIEEAHRHISVHGSWDKTAQKARGLVLVQHDTLSSFETTLYEPVLCLILQGRKQASIGEHTFSFGPGECLLVSHDQPVASRVTKAPYLSLVLAVDASTIRKLYDEVESVTDSEPARAVITHRADAGLIDALHRYLALASTPVDAKVLGPLVLKEIHYRLLTAPFGGMLRRLIRHDSSASAIARAIGHIRDDLRAPIAIPELARRVGMSASAFHKHFKDITSTTPLQYQKELRLLEARQLLQQGGVSVTRVALDVGYESTSQFSREYARLFGRPPSRDAESAAL